MTSMSALLAALLVIGVVSMPLHDPQDSLSKMMKDVQTIVDGRAAAYNCTFSVALRTPSLGSLKWASGEVTNGHLVYTLVWHEGTDGYGTSSLYMLSPPMQSMS